MSEENKNTADELDEFYDEFTSESGTDNSPENSEDEIFVLPKKKPKVVVKRVSLRGINAHRAEISIKNAATNEQEPIASTSNPNQNQNIVGRGHGLVLHHNFNHNVGRVRGRGRGRGLRVEMLDAHKQFVEEIREEEVADGTFEQRIKKKTKRTIIPVPKLNDGNTDLIFFLIHLYSLLSYFIEEAHSKCEEYLLKIKNGLFNHSKKNAKSPVWDILHQIIDENGDIIPHFFICIKCEQILYKYRTDSNTSGLARHTCIKHIQSTDEKIDTQDIENMKIMAAKFICLDLRPFNAIECTGLHDLVMAGVEWGKKYPNLTMDQFLKFFPCRNTVRKMISHEATRAQYMIKIMFEESIKQGGLGCTLDLWTDPHKSNSYMAITANVFLLRDNRIDNKRLVFHMGLISDLVKTKYVIKQRIVKVFNDFDVSIAQLKDFVTFTTDR